MLNLAQRVQELQISTISAEFVADVDQRYSFTDPHGIIFLVILFVKYYFRLDDAFIIFISLKCSIFTLHTTFTVLLSMYVEIHL